MRVLEVTPKVLFIALVLAGCSSLSHITKPPPFSPMGTSKSDPNQTFENNNNAHSGYQPANPVGPGVASASLWRSGPDALFGDRRARKIGDIVTILVEIDDEAEIKNRTGRSRSGADSISAPSLLGVGELARRVLPGGAGIDPAIEAASTAASSGEGTIKRNEKITLRLAATIVDVLPNGHLIVSGGQEVRVNYELRELQVSGIIRTEDISRLNVITYDKIAEARISYGGRGQISDMQRARYGQQIIDIVSPF